jgi:hypothetical protein
MTHEPPLAFTGMSEPRIAEIVRMYIDFGYQFARQYLPDDAAASLVAQLACEEAVTRFPETRKAILEKLMKEDG